VYQSVLADVRLFELLGRIDHDLARSAQAGGCRRCGGRLDRADYARKPRGLSAPEHAALGALPGTSGLCRRGDHRDHGVASGSAACRSTSAAGVARGERTHAGAVAPLVARRVRGERVLAPRPRSTAHAGADPWVAGRAAAPLRRRPPDAADRGAALPRSDHHGGRRYVRDGGGVHRTRRRCALRSDPRPPRVRSDLARTSRRERSTVDERVPPTPGP